MYKITQKNNRIFVPIWPGPKIWAQNCQNRDENPDFTLKNSPTLTFRTKSKISRYLSPVSLIGGEFSMQKQLDHCLNIQNLKETLCAINNIRLKYRFSKRRKISKFFKYNHQILKFWTYEILPGKLFHFPTGLTFDMGKIPMLEQTLTDICRLDSLEL